MYQTINQDSFRQAFADAGRGHQFSRTALDALYEHLADQEADGDVSYELDVIALCCSYTECKSADDVQALYPDIEFALGVGDMDKLQIVHDYLQQHTEVVRCDPRCIVFLNF